MKTFLLFRKQIVAFMILACISATNAFAQTPDLVVAKDGSGNYTTVQAAINAAPTGRTSPYRIYIKNGIYKEKINIPSTKPFIQIIGESVANVILTWDDYSGKPIPGGGTYGTSTSASFTVTAADFTAINITFENTTGESPQALAIYVTGDRSAFKNCRFLGGQDTVFAGQPNSATISRQYFRNCYIDGTVDFIFGDARAVFDSCVIYAKTRAVAGSSYITAANTKQIEPYGYVFRNCQIPPNRGGTVYYLGRPWQNDASTSDAAKSYNKTIFLNTKMGSSIQPGGWSTWDAGTDVTKITYAEYKSRNFDGSLVNTSARVPWSKQLTDDEAAVYYNNSNLFGSWDPCSVYTDFCTNAPMPIAVSNFKGVKGTSTSTFTWNLSWPIAGVKYEVLRSSDRTTFTKVSEQTGGADSLINFTFTETIPPPGVTWYYLVQASKAGYNTHITDTVVISSTPTISVAGSMGSFIQGVGAPSNPQSYTVTGSSLTNNLIVTAPAGYEISANNGTSWNNSSTPLVFTPDVNGNVPTTPISVRLNAGTAGTYSGNIIHASAGADTVRMAVTGTVQSEPLTVSEMLQWWTMSTNNADSAGVRSVGVTASTPTFNNLVLSDNTTVPAVPAYSSNHGQGFAPQANGSWVNPPGPGGSLSRLFYEQFTITAASTHSLRVDSLILTTSIYNSANGRFAVAFSRTGFATDSTDLTTASFATPIVLNNETAGNTTTYRLAFAGGTGITLTSGQTLTYRLYYAVGSGSAGRYAKLKNVQVKGLATANPIAGSFRSKQSGNWTDVNTWERYDGTQWVSPAPEYPHFNSYNSNGETTTIMSGHTVTHGTAFSLGFGYIPRRTRINSGGQMIVSNGVNLNLGNDGTPAAATVDLQVDGTLTLLGGIFTNGNVFVLINGNFINSGTGMNLSNTGDTVAVGANGNYQHNVNNVTTPLRWFFNPTATLRVTGLTTAQTGLFKNNVTYGNIVWNNTGESAYYAVRATLDSVNVKGSFTVHSTGTTNLTFNQAAGRKVFPGGYYQTGGTVNFRENGNGADTLDLGGDFSVTGGTFNSLENGSNSLLLRLNGIGKSIAYSQNGATNTNWQVNGSYTLASNIVLPNSGYGVTVNGTLDAATFAMSGSGDFTLSPGAFLITASPSGVNGSVTTTGNKNLGTTGNFTFNGSTAQTTGNLLPATVNTLTVNNNSGVTLNGGNLTASSSVTLTNGRLLLGNNTVTTTSVLAANSTRYVVTDGVGFLKINNIGAGLNVFPVGPNTASYNPATINNVGASDNYSVNVKTTFDQPVPDANKVVNRQWMINEDVAGGSNVTLSLSWTAAEQAVGFNPAAAVVILRYNGSTWEKYPATVTGSGTTASPYVATATGITSFSPFIVANESALPLNLLSFNAGYDNSDLNIWWKTTNEINAKLFDVERSADGRTFIKIGTVSANNFARENSYSFTDKNPLTGIVYYRLRSVDNDGSYKLSRVVTVNSKLKGRLTIYPNPATNIVTLTHARANANTTISIVTIDGKQVITQKLQLNSTQTSVDVTRLNSGAYLVVVNNGTERTSLRFTKE